MNVRVGIAALIFMLSTSVPGAPLQSNISLKNEVERAIERGGDWLVKNQKENGYWSTTDHPAVTALALVAFQGKSELDADEKAAVKKGYDFLLQNYHDDGTIHGGKGLLNYNTSIGLLALVAARNADYKPKILAARKYLVGTQIDLGKEGKLDTRFDGGVGYGSKGEHSDMANTLQALEAAVAVLAPKGLLTIAIYPGHAGGTEELRAIGHWATGLQPQLFEVQQLRPVNRTASPPECWVVWRKA